MSKRFTDGHFALGLTVGIFSTVLLTLLASSGYEPDTQLSYAIDQSANNTNQCGNGNEPVWGPWFGLCFGLFDSVAQWLMMAFAIVAAGLLYGTLMQANKTNIAAVNASEAAMEANRIMRSEQRPWLDLINPVATISIDRDWIVFEIHARVINVGKSPATEVLAHVKHGILPEQVRQNHVAFRMFVNEWVGKAPITLIGKVEAFAGMPCPTVFRDRQEPVYSVAGAPENEAFMFGRLYIDLCVTYRSAGGSETFHVAMRGEIPEEQVVAGATVPLGKVSGCYSIG